MTKRKVKHPFNPVSFYNFNLVTILFLISLSEKLSVSQNWLPEYSGNLFRLQSTGNSVVPSKANKSTQQLKYLIKSVFFFFWWSELETFFTPLIKMVSVGEGWSAINQEWASLDNIWSKEMNQSFFCVVCMHEKNKRGRGSNKGRGKIGENKTCFPCQWTKWS